MAETETNLPSPPNSLAFTAEDDQGPFNACPNHQDVHPDLIESGHAASEILLHKAATSIFGWQSPVRSTIDDPGETSEHPGGHQKALPSSEASAVPADMMLNQEYPEGLFHGVNSSGENGILASDQSKGTEIEGDADKDIASGASESSAPRGGLDKPQLPKFPADGQILYNSTTTSELFASTQQSNERNQLSKDERSSLTEAATEISLPDDDGNTLSAELQRLNDSTEDKTNHFVTDQQHQTTELCTVAAMDKVSPCSQNIGGTFRSPQVAAPVLESHYPEIKVTQAKEVSNEAKSTGRDSDVPIHDKMKSRRTDETGCNVSTNLQVESHVDEPMATILSPNFNATGKPVENDVLMEDVNEQIHESANEIGNVDAPRTKGSLRARSEANDIVGVPNTRMESARAEQKHSLEPAHTDEGTQDTELNMEAPTSFSTTRTRVEPEDLSSESNITVAQVRDQIENPEISQGNIGTSADRIGYILSGKLHEPPPKFIYNRPFIDSDDEDTYPTSTTKSGTNSEPVWTQVRGSLNCDDCDESNIPTPAETLATRSESPNLETKLHQGLSDYLAVTAGEAKIHDLETTSLTEDYHTEDCKPTGNPSPQKVHSPQDFGPLQDGEPLERIIMRVILASGEWLGLSKLTKEVHALTRPGLFNELSHAAYSAMRAEITSILKYHDCPMTVLVNSRGKRMVGLEPHWNMEYYDLIRHNITHPAETCQPTLGTIAFLALPHRIQLRIWRFVLHMPCQTAWTPNEVDSDDISTHEGDSLGITASGSSQRCFISENEDGTITHSLPAQEILAFTKVCRALYSQATPRFYELNKFRFDHPTKLQSFLQGIGKRSSYLQNLVFKYDPPLFNGGNYKLVFKMLHQTNLKYLCLEIEEESVMARGEGCKSIAHLTGMHELCQLRGLGTLECVGQFDKTARFLRPIHRKTRSKGKFGEVVDQSPERPAIPDYERIEDDKHEQSVATTVKDLREQIMYDHADAKRSERETKLEEAKRARERRLRQRRYQAAQRMEAVEAEKDRKRKRREEENLERQQAREAEAAEKESRRLQKVEARQQRLIREEKERARKATERENARAERELEKQQRIMASVQKKLDIAQAKQKKVKAQKREARQRMLEMQSKMRKAARGCDEESDVTEDAQSSVSNDSDSDYEEPPAKKAKIKAVDRSARGASKPKAVGTTKALATTIRSQRSDGKMTTMTFTRQAPAINPYHNRYDDRYDTTSDEDTDDPQTPGEGEQGQLIAQTKAAQAISVPSDESSDEDDDSDND